MSEIPAQIIGREIKDVTDEKHQPTLNTLELLTLTGLSSSQPDNRPMIARLAGSDSLLSVLWRYRHVKKTQKQIIGLSERVFGGFSNPNEDMLAARILALGCAQIVREAPIYTCSYVEGLMDDTLVHRPELFAVVQTEFQQIANEVPYLPQRHLIEVMLQKRILSIINRNLGARN